MAFTDRFHNRGSVSTGYDIDNSLKLEANNTEIIYRANESGTNRKTFTASVWFKRTELGVAQEVWHGGRNGEMVGMGMLTYSGFTDQLWVDIGGGSGNTGTLYRSASTQKIRDTSAWYHMVLAVDTTQSTAANRMKVWLNGVEVTSWAQHQIPAEDYQGALESGTDMAWGGFRPNNSELFSGYITECHYLDGVAKVQTDFGEYDEDSGIWKPKAYTGTYGNNGSYMKFDDSSALGADSSGNSNTFTLVNIAAADQSTDTPTNNFCTFNAINMYGSTATLAEGATFTASTGNGAFTTYGTMSPSSGKWWWEGKIQVNGSTAYACIGATTNLAGLPAVSAQLSGGHVIKLAKGQKWVLNDTGYNYGAQYEDGSIINIGLDLDNRRFYSYKNGTVDDANGIDISSTTFDGFGSQWMPLVITYGDGGASSYEINFGGYRTYSISSAASDANGYGTFEYAPPSGYYSLCTKNLAEYG
tara:strand:+ start:42 stop:1457 length:1416 start_codon:yes stop_codon:yes gene_type:complete